MLLLATRCSGVLGFATHVSPSAPPQHHCSSFVLLRRLARPLPMWPPTELLLSFYWPAVAVFMGPTACVQLFCFHLSSHSHPLPSTISSPFSLSFTSLFFQHPHALSSLSPLLLRTIRSTQLATLTPAQLSHPRLDSSLPLTLFPPLTAGPARGEHGHRGTTLQGRLRHGGASGAQQTGAPDVQHGLPMGPVPGATARSEYLLVVF